MNRHHFGTRILFWGYVLMAAWLLIADAHRIALDLDAGTVTWTSYVGAALGLFALVLAIPIADEARSRRKRPPR